MSTKMRIIPSFYRENETEEPLFCLIILSVQIVRSGQSFHFWLSQQIYYCELDQHARHTLLSVV